MDEWCLLCSEILPTVSHDDGLLPAETRGGGITISTVLVALALLVKWLLFSAAIVGLGPLINCGDFLRAGAGAAATDGMRSES